jgi:uncharacterized delta-60 repeat protein
MKKLTSLKYLPNLERHKQSLMRSRFRPNLSKTALFICFAFVSLTGMAWAQAGQLDTTFASKGIFVLSSIGEQNGSTSVALQSDGKVVFAGASGNAQLANNGIALVRLNTNGSPDATFGIDGVVSFGVDGSVPVSVLIQPDGKIVVGSTAGQTDGGGPALSRFNSNGTLDDSFGTGGHVDARLLGIGINALVLQPDGKILVTGEQ